MSASETSLVQPTLPFRRDVDGSLRVGKSRVLVEVVLQLFQQGATPEQIVQSFETTTLAEIYSVIAYYLNCPNEMKAYLVERQGLAIEVKQRIDSRQGDLGNIRSRLLARTT